MDPAHTGFQGRNLVTSGTPGPSLGQKGPRCHLLLPCHSSEPFLLVAADVTAAVLWLWNQSLPCGVLEREQSLLSFHTQGQVGL